MDRHTSPNNSNNNNNNDNNNSNSNPETSTTTGKDTGEGAADVEQHCLLFPTYATRYSRSGSKDPLDWNIRVRGWAFSKRSNRRKRLIMSMARKLAGVTKDNKVYETLESRFGMFLANNTQGARFSIQCVGLAQATHMELAGAPNLHNQTVNVLMDELTATDSARAAAEAVQDKAELRKSLEENRGGYVQEAERDHNVKHERGPPDSNGRWQRMQSSTAQDYSKVADESEDQEPAPADRWSKGAALVKGAYRKYKPIVAAQVSNYGNNNENGKDISSNSLEAPPSISSRDRSSPTTNSPVPGSSTGAPTDPLDVPPIIRTESGESVMSQTNTHYEDLGYGSFPTVQVSSRLGGHFDGTLRVSQKEVMAHRREQGKGGHPRFLKLHAYHQDMKEPCQGVVNLVDPEGISIISDIDDTIKETNIAAGAKIILRNTFLNDMQDVPGMAAVYQKWWKDGAAIHYVSNSPWQLIPSLLEFFHSHKFPPGSAHLRLHDSMLKTYFMTPGDHKRKCIKEILTDFPDRKFVLIGDSGEIDMEIYTELAIAYPEQVFKIFIRDITTARLQAASAKNGTSTPPAGRLVTSIMPIKAVTAGFNLFSRGDNESTTSVNSSNNTTEDSSTPRSMNSPEEPRRQPPKLPMRPSQTPSSSSSPSSMLEQTTPPSLPKRPSQSPASNDSKDSKMLEQTTPPNLPKRPSQPPMSNSSTYSITPEMRMPQRPSPKTLASSFKGNSALDASTAAAIATAAGTAQPMAMGGSTFTKSTTTDNPEVDDDPMPGCPPPDEPQPIKTPLEVWQDRIKVCQDKLLPGTLIFFEDAGTLGEDTLVSEMIRHYKDSSIVEDEMEENNDDRDRAPGVKTEKLIDV
ncbi:hypothetical protein BGZ98_001455 [Dissophora globulifera]|nr:hypothetical protein BGZ98_001455 [Dissophora globulifera]